MGETGVRAEPSGHPTRAGLMALWRSSGLGSAARTSLVAHPALRDWRTIGSGLETRAVMTEAGDGVRLWWESAGEGPPVLLVPGRGDSTDIYPVRFTHRLLAGGCRVIRYDPRDTGMSGDGGSTYAVTDMADDAAAVLAAAEIDAAHLVGISMGGLLLVDLCRRRPDLVASLVFVAALSPDPAAGMGEDFFAAIGADPLEAMVQAMGDPSPETRAWVQGELDRAGRRAPARPEAAQKHQDAAFRLGWPQHEVLGTIGVPALVMHGDGDRVLPLQHAHSLAAGIAGAELAVVAGMGHLPRPADWDVIAERTVAHVVRSTRGG
jgi:pimeloyl-ACP methyl ester carboxylesterase